MCTYYINIIIKMLVKLYQTLCKISKNIQRSLKFFSMLKARFLPETHDIIGKNKSENIYLKLNYEKKTD